MKILWSYTKKIILIGQNNKSIDDNLVLTSLILFWRMPTNTRKVYFARLPPRSLRHIIQMKSLRRGGRGGVQRERGLNTLFLY